MKKRYSKYQLAITVAVSLVQMVVAKGVLAEATVTTQPDVKPEIAPYFNNPITEPKLSTKELINLLQTKVKYIFIIFNENHSFDNEYGTFPGVNGLYFDGQNTRSADKTLGFSQTYKDVSGKLITVEPFRIESAQNSTVVDSVDHSHKGLATKLHVVKGQPRMDQFAYDEYSRFALLGGTANLSKGKQYARLVMSYIDCDTIPFYWKWASNFTIFDNIFATEDTPSTPNAVAMLAGQSGESQWVKHGSQGHTYLVNDHLGTTQGLPLVNDPQPFYGSQFDTTTKNKQPQGTHEFYGDNNIASNLTFASLVLTFEGRNIQLALSENQNRKFDLPDIQQDIPYIQRLNTNPVNWRWYEEGYDLEPTDINGLASHNAYISHHNGAQYFGYIANTPKIHKKGLRGLGDFFGDLEHNKLPQGGVFYIRGGYINQDDLKPPITNPSTTQDEIAAIYAAKKGDDDHPAYSDRQISEAMAARVINAIAERPEIWYKSVIVIAYDESDGFYDHVPPRILSYGPDKLPLSRGIRVPLILISPYARTHSVSHVEGDNNAVIQTINIIFGLPPLASLPDEAQALVKGDSPEFNQFGPPGFHQKYLGPRDLNSPITDSLLSGFDPQRLNGSSPPLPPYLAHIPDKNIDQLPHYGGKGCQAIGITPEDLRQGIINKIPPGFNSLPSTYPQGN